MQRERAKARGRDVGRSPSVGKGERRKGSESVRRADVVDTITEGDQEIVFRCGRCAGLCQEAISRDHHVQEEI